MTAYRAYPNGLALTRRGSSNVWDGDDGCQYTTVGETVCRVGPPGSEPAFGKVGGTLHVGPVTDAKAHADDWEPLPRAPGNPLAERIAMARAMWRTFQALPVTEHRQRGLAYEAFCKAEEHAQHEVSAMCREPPVSR